MDSTYFTQTRAEIRPLLPRGARTAMEVGCGAGSTLRWLKAEHGLLRTIGIEIEVAVATRAAQCVDEVHVADITDNCMVLAPYRGEVDLLLLLDVLEHLRNPLGTLMSLKAVLTKNGSVIASIPNVRSIKVLLPLIFRGEFRYTDSGILDRTHVVFFTKKSIIRMFDEAGFKSVAIRGNGALSIAEAKTTSGKFVALFNIATFGLFEGFLANQWLIAAQPKAEFVGHA